MKKVLSLILCGILFTAIIPLSSCKKQTIRELNVYNWEDYIACEDFDMVAEFEAWHEKTYGEKIVVNYSTFGTNENMYNELKLTQKGDSFSYDLVCPSEYMIQKMIIEGMCEEFDYSQLENYTKNVAPYIQDLFVKNDWYKYATCFNWGTMGFTYYPVNDEGKGVEYDDVSSWSVVTNTKYANKITIKDSVRDSYVLALGNVNGQKLLDLQNQPNFDELSTEYNKQVHELLNDFSDESIEKSRVFLTETRKNLYGFEVDSGKQDMATGKLWINFAWSGDAVYAMDLAEEEGTFLEYVVPKEGSNIFFDGWVMPKGADKELAQRFLNFMYDEANAIENLDYICYSSPIVGEQVFEYVSENYGLTTLIEVPQPTGDELEDLVFVGDKYYKEVPLALDPNFSGQSTYSLTYYDEESGEIVTDDPIEIYAHNVKHFFGDKISGDGIIYTDSLNRQLVAMYPTAETMNRCVIMEHLETADLKKLNNMWDSVKVGYMKYSTMLIIVIVAVVVLALLTTLYILKKKGVRIILPKKHLGKLVKSERIK
ncbi:MAG: extracellular solute-binding protein [Clostridia bacterium]|nr:extracellular solute-binding protein [Clostridia bacterium]